MNFSELIILFSIVFIFVGPIYSLLIVITNFFMDLRISKK